MAHQSVRHLLPLVGLVALGCSDDIPWEGTFDLPSAVAVLPVTDDGLFDEPIGYAANAHGGTISLLALKQGRYLTDNGAASFVRSAPLATGRARMLGALAVWSPSPDHIDVFAADRAHRVLVRVPHITDVVDGYPQRHPVAYTEPVFVDADDSGDAASIDDVQVRPGYTATETWTAEFDGVQWWVTGSRSGLQPRRVSPGQRFVAEQRAVEFNIIGTASAGDSFSFDTDSGIEEYDLDGTPRSLALSPDGSLLAVIVHDEGLGTSEVKWFDPAQGTIAGTVSLPVGAEPTRMAWTTDGTSLFLADSAHPAVYEVSAGATDAKTTHALPWPVLDVAPLLSDDDQLLYVAPVGGRAVWVYDLVRGELRDINPLTDEVDGIDFDNAVTGLEPIPLAYRWPETDAEGVRLWGRSVAVSTYNGKVLFMEEGTGCLVRDQFGPRSELLSSFSSTRDYSTSFSRVSSPATLEENGANDRSVVVHPCGGVALREGWTLTYRRNLQAWEVEGSRSGVQKTLAYENERYLSDNGAISFTLRSGLDPSEEGWQINFNVLPGVVEGNGDNDEDGTRDVEFDLPGDPVFFHYRVNSSDFGWEQIDDRPFVLVPAEGSDLVGRVEPQSGEVEVAWW